MWTRLRALVVKELLAVLRDPRGRAILIGPPIVQLLVFSYAATLLSGFATPIENMPTWLQPITLANPLRHFLVIVRGVFLKDLPAAEIAANTLPLALIASVTLGAAAWLFRRRLQ